MTTHDETAPEAAPSVPASVLGVKKRFATARAALGELSDGEVQILIGEHMVRRFGRMRAAIYLANIRHDVEAMK